ncbi:MAG: hypothetical protein Aurels2KO_25870 [Aureliella sp.]
MPDRLHRAEVAYEGRVQGVGFRITVVELTEGLELVGRVCNASDGSVRLWAEGGQEELLELLSRIRRRFARNIVRENADWTEIDARSTVGFVVGEDLVR